MFSFLNVILLGFILNSPIFDFEGNALSNPMLEVQVGLEIKSAYILYEADIELDPVQEDVIITNSYQFGFDTDFVDFKLILDSGNDFIPDTFQLKVGVRF